jgi:hypothetical protein
MRVMSFILSIAGAVLLAACGQSGVYYEKTPEQVAAALKDAYLPTHILGGGIERSRVSQPDANTVVTALIGGDGSEAMRFVTTITPDGTGSRVLTVIQPPEGKNKERAAEMMASQAYAMSMMDSLAQEHVAAAIEGRAFDMMFATNPAAKAMLNSDPQMREQLRQINEANTEFARMEQEMAAAEGTSRSGHGSRRARDRSEPEFGQPMLDPGGD